MIKSSQTATLADALFGFGKTKKAVIGILFSKPEMVIHLRELARLAGTSPQSLAAELAIFVSAGVIISRRDGNRVTFQANPDCPVFDELRGIAKKTSGVADVIRTALAGRDIEMAFIFGSMATGMDGANSDVDLMVIGDIDGIELNGLLAPVEGVLRRPIHITQYALEEIPKIQQDKILNKILSSPKIMVIDNGSDATSSIR